MRFRRFAIPFAFLMLIASAVPTTGAKPSPPPTADDDTAYYTQVSGLIEAMRRQGKDQDKIDARLQADFGWVAVSQGGDEIVALSTENSNVTMTTPTVYWNSSQGRYEASAAFYWKNCGSRRCWYDDFPFFGPNVGGYDGFGLSISKLVTRRTQFFSVYTETGTRTSYPNPWDADDSGATFRNQDKMTCEKACYNWDHGILIYAFTIRPGCPSGNYQINSKLGHTWSGAGVSSISVSLNGISVTFAGSNEHWQAVNPTPRNWYPCG
jgi:hypothetical protein